MARRELDRRMPAVDGFAVVLRRLSGAIDANWQRAADASDPEGLHDLRVALRRTRALVHAGRKVLPQPLVVAATDRLRDLTAATGPARDLDVLVMAWRRDVDLPALLDRIEAARGAARTRLGLALADPTAAQWCHRWSGEVAGAPRAASPGLHADRRLGKVVARQLRRSQRRVLGAGRELAPTTGDGELHQLRKDARRLRYLLEAFAELAPGQEATFVRRLKSFQDVLGRHQDLVVQLGIIESLAVGPAADALLVQLAAERDGLRAEFAERFERYDTRRARRSFDELVDHVRGRHS